MHQCRDLSTVEDALQDAYLQACQQWQKQGMPENPVAWLHSVAKRRLIDRLRRQRTTQDGTMLHEMETRYQWRYAEAEGPMGIPDDRLRLIFTCCHPALSQEAQIALTLKIICGLNSREIARAFLIQEDTLNRRLSRAKQKIALAGIAYEVPEGQALAARLPSVLGVIYLLFNESYQACEEPQLTQEDLAQEAIRLGRLLYELQPSTEAGGLLALMELHWARRAGRGADASNYIPLEQQQRDRWDRKAIAQSTKFLLNVMSHGDVGVYQIQAAISALHANAPSFSEVDWPQVLGLYEELYRRLPTTVVMLNYWVARSFVEDPQVVLDELQKLFDTATSYQPFHAACADIARRAGMKEQAAAAYRRAIDLSPNGTERDFLQQRLSALLH